LIVPELFFSQALVVGVEIEISLLNYFVRYLYPNMVVSVESKQLFEKPNNHDKIDLLWPLEL